MHNYCCYTHFHASQHKYKSVGYETIYRRPTYKCEDAINANANVFPDSQLAYYIHGDESRRAHNAIIEFAISLKTQSFYYAFKCGPTVRS